MYEKERGTTVYNGRFSEWNADNTKDPSTGVSKKDLFRGVGLMYPSDYGYAVGGNVRDYCLNNTLYNSNSGSCYTNNWLYKNNGYFWLLSPSPIGNIFAFLLLGDGSVRENGTVRNADYIYPAVYLSSRWKLGNGNGTQTEPYNLIIG